LKPRQETLIPYFSLLLNNLLVLHKVFYMRMNLLLRNIFLTACLLSLQTAALAQAGVTNGLLEKGFYKGFITSADQSKIAFYEPGQNNTFNFVILNLKDFTQRKMEAFNVMALPTPDLLGQYWVQVLERSNKDSTKPNFRLHYSPDGTVANKKVFEGSWYPFGFTEDGKVIAADVSFMNVSDFITARNLRIVDPNTGADIKSLVPGPLLTAEESKGDMWSNHSFSWHLQKGMLIRINIRTGATRLFYFDGKPARDYTDRVLSYGMSDSLLLTGEMYNAANGRGRLQAYGLLSRKKLVDSTYFNRTFAAAHSFAYGRIWAIHENTAGLTEYALTGGPMKIVKIHPLDLSAVSFFSTTDNYQALVISKAANRVAMIPTWATINNEIPMNEGYIWELSTGKLLQRISNFYTAAKSGIPMAAFNKEKALADEKAYFDKLAAEQNAKAAAGPCGDAKAQLKIKVGSWVREGKDGRAIQLTDYDCRTQRYTGSMRFVNNKSLSTTSFQINLFEVSSDISKPKYKVVTANTCSKCNGSGTLSGKRNYEKVEYGIYNKYTTSGTTSFTDLCGQCKGDGVVTY